VSDRLLQSPVCCPTCGAPPRIRVPATAVGRVIHGDPGDVVVTYRCHIRRCGTVYAITVRDLTDAA
jgi:hypothetical protein